MGEHFAFSYSSPAPTTLPLVPFSFQKEPPPLQCPSTLSRTFLTTYPPSLHGPFIPKFGFCSKVTLPEKSFLTTLYHIMPLDHHLLFSSGFIHPHSTYHCLFIIYLPNSSKISTKVKTLPVSFTSCISRAYNESGTKTIYVS